MLMIKKIEGTDIVKPHTEMLRLPFLSRDLDVNQSCPRTGNEDLDS